MTRVPEGFDLESFLPYLLNQAAEATSRAFQAVYRDRYGMTRTQWRVLAHLDRSGAVSSAATGASNRESHLAFAAADRAAVEAFFAAARSDDDFARCAGRLGCFSWFFAGLRIDRRWRGAGKQQCRKPHCCGKRCCRGPKPEIDHGIPLFILNFPDS